MLAIGVGAVAFGLVLLVPQASCAVGLRPPCIIFFRLVIGGGFLISVGFAVLWEDVIEPGCRYLLRR